MQPGLAIAATSRSLGITHWGDMILRAMVVTTLFWLSIVWIYHSAFAHLGTAISPLGNQNIRFVLGSSVQIQTGIPSVSESLADDFLVGAAIWRGDIAGPHSELLKKHFNSITAENDMKWASLRPSEAAFDFTGADALISFARANHMRVRGHTLLWHKQNPQWLFKDVSGNDMSPTPENKALLLQSLEQHIRVVVSHYKDDVYAWDAINEVIDPKQADGFRRTPWFLITGTDYIDTAFRIAHEVAPRAKLFINEYDTTNPGKRAFLYNLVGDLKTRNVPVDGVGHQMHIDLEEPPAAAITGTINMFSALGVDNQITELDVSVYPNESDNCSSIPDAVLIQQGYRYRDIFQALRQLKGKISAVTFWGLADDHTWLKKFPIERLDLPLLFDERLQAKPAYWGIVGPTQLPALGKTAYPAAIDCSPSRNRSSLRSPS
jgi:endo-1,4-beta-xylanase